MSLNDPLLILVKQLTLMGLHISVPFYHKEGANPNNPHGRSDRSSATVTNQVIVACWQSRMSKNPGIMHVIMEDRSSDSSLQPISPVFKDGVPVYHSLPKCFSATVIESLEIKDM